MLIALSAKNKLGFIDETLARPKDDSPDLKFWIRCNDMVFAWLLNSLTAEIRSSVIHSKSARLLWKQLEDRYGQSNLAQSFELQKQLLETVQGSSNSATYFNKMKAIWDETELLDAREVCLCVDCNCEALVRNQALEERQKLVQFLMGLNETYTGVRGNIMMMQPAPTIDRAYYLLLQEERQRSIQSVGHFPSESSSFAALGQKFVQNLGRSHNFNMSSGASSSGNNYSGGTSNGNYYSSGSSGGNNYFGGSSGGNNNPGGSSGGNNFRNTQDYRKHSICNYYKKPGHTIDKCFKIHGYPQSPRYNNKQRRYQHSAQAHVATTNEGNGQFQNYDTGETVGINQGQLTQLLELLQQVKIGQQAATSSEVNVTANCAGPFFE